METIDLPEPVRREIKNGNFVRAVQLAVENNLRSDRVRELEHEAVRQFIEIWHNFEGAKVLIAKYDLGAEEVRTILKSVLDSSRAQNVVRNCFNAKSGRMAAMTLAQRILRDPVLRKYV